MTQKPIFIHSMFRTGSTYLWSKFRKNDRYYCYYEPLHHVLTQVTPENIDEMLTRDFEAVHHPVLESYYLQEYIPLLKENQIGVPFFKKEFSYDQFCNNNENPQLIEYIDSLIKYPIGKIPVLKFNRTAFRAKWFKQFYKNALNLYLIRSPRDQWQSYIELHKRTAYHDFFLMDLLAVNANYNHPDFAPLSKIVPLFPFNNSNPEKEFLFYKHLLPNYSEEERYFIFYYIWFDALLKNIINSDFIVDINLLTQDKSYREKIENLFQERGYMGVNFQDAKIERYSHYCLPSDKFDKIEENVRALIISYMSNEQIDTLFNALQLHPIPCFSYTKEYFYKIKNTPQEYQPLDHLKRIEMLRKIISFFIDESLEQFEKIKSLEEQLLEKNIKSVIDPGTSIDKKESLKDFVKKLQSKGIEIHQIHQYISTLEHQLHKTRNSYSYKFGRMLLSPFITFKSWIDKNSATHSNESDKLKKSPSPNTQFKGKINLNEQMTINYGRHRSGWHFVISHMNQLHNPDGVYLDTFIERTFCWNPKGIKPHKYPWIGFIHVPPNVPQWFHYEQSNQMIFQSKAWKESLPYCKGLFTLSQYHQKYLEPLLKIPVQSLLHPTEFPSNTWSWDKFSANKEKKILQVGWWLRMLHAIYILPSTQYKKVFLNVEHPSITPLMQKEKEILMENGTFRDDMYDTAEIIRFLPDSEYDRYLCENIVLAYLYDSSANNTVIECIARNTPLLINPIEPVQEYLGKEYPLYYNSFEEAAQKAMNYDLIRQTHVYLTNLSIKKKLTTSYFLDSFVESSIYRNL